MNTDPAYNRKIEETEPLNDKQQVKVEKKYGFHNGKAYSNIDMD